MVSRSFFVVAMCAILGLLAASVIGTVPASASTGRLAASVSQYAGAVSTGAEKYFTVNLLAGSTTRDAELVARYFRSYGLSIEVSPDHEILFAHGTYGQAAAAAHTGFARYRFNGEVFTAVTVPERFPAVIASHIIATTINEGPSMRPLYRAIPAGFFAPSGGYTPSQIATFYDIAPIASAGIKGTGRSAAIFSCGAITLADITTFESFFGLPSNTPTIVKVDGGPTMTSFEPTGDIERELSTAPAEKITLYEVPDDCSSGHMADGLAKIAADTVTKKYDSVNISYGSEEDWIMHVGGSFTAIDADLASLLSKNATPFVASGDSGAFPNSAHLLNAGEVTVSFPASSNHVVSVGGTTALTKTPTVFTRLEELAWGNGGGGVSSVFSIPSWQVGVSGYASTTKRNVPDVALDADINTGYQIIYTSGGVQGLYIGGGTSFAAPGWAAFIPLVDQKRVALGKAALTSVPTKLFAEKTVAGDYTDITLGCNGFYCAKTGADNVTGIGVYDAFKLYTSLTALP